MRTAFSRTPENFVQAVVNSRRKDVSLDGPITTETMPFEPGFESYLRKTIEDFSLAIYQEISREPAQDTGASVEVRTR